MKWVKSQSVIVMFVFCVLGGCDYINGKKEFDQHMEVCSAAEQNGLLETASLACKKALAVADEKAYSLALISDLLYKLARLERQQQKFGEAEALIIRSLTIEENSVDKKKIASRLIELSLNLAGQDRWLHGVQILKRTTALLNGMAGNDLKAGINALKLFSVRLNMRGYIEEARQCKAEVIALEKLDSKSAVQVEVAPKH
jgi:hypothetical protein